MNDYSRHFSIPETFILDIKFNINKNVMSVKFANGETFTYPINKENVSKFENILTQQYMSVFDNTEKILKDEDASIIFIISLVIFIVPTIWIIKHDPSFESVIPALGLDGAFVAGIISSIKNKRNERKKLAIAKEFYENKKELLEAMSKEPNITKMATNGVQSVLNTQLHLASEEIVSDPMNIFLVDAAMNSDNMEDIERMLKKLKTYRGLISENPSMMIDNKKEKRGFSRTRRKK